MITVKVVNSDGIIWNPEQVAIEIIKASAQGPVILDLMHEGPCCNTVGIDTMLDSIVATFNFDPALYTIKTSNQLPSSRYKEHRKSFVELSTVQEKARSLCNSNSTLEKRFGSFISRSNWLRLAISSYLYNHHADATIMTYHYSPDSDYHTDHFGLEKLLNKHWEEIDQITNFLKQLPIRAESYQYPILWSNRALDLDIYYQKIFCDVICESYFSGKSFLITEKTMRAIAHRRPFIVQGPQWYLHNLKLLGFKTFDQWWDEGYDEDPWDFKYQALKQNIDYIAKQNTTTIAQWNKEMLNVLDHNYNTLNELTAEKILSTKFFFQ